MKEQDLNKHLDNIIIKGLIREAQQDDADFEAAMRKISDEDFERIVGCHTYAKPKEVCLSYDMQSPDSHSIAHDMDLLKSRSMTDDFDSISEWGAETTQQKKSENAKRKLLKPWLVSTVAAVAVILIVLIPTLNYMNNMEGKLCDSALYASEYFISPARGGFDVATASTEEIEKELPALEASYKELGIPASGADIEEVYEFEEAGWNLAVAYLRLHKKSNAVAVLQVLAYGDYPHGDTGLNEHCAELLKSLK